MYSFKEKFTEKLSRFLTDVPSQPQQSTQANSRSKGENTVSSFFPLISPLSTRKKTEDDLKPLQSSPVRWHSKVRASSRSEYKMLDCSAEDECSESASSHAEQEAPVSASRTGASEILEDAVQVRSLDKIMPNLTTDSLFVYAELYEFLQSSLPNIVKGCQWVLLYSTLRHGISLRTLIRKSADLSGPALLIVGDRKGAIFGGLLDCPLKPSPKRKYQGTNQTFVFTTRYGEPRLFRATGANRYFYMCLNDFLAFGGGGNFALALDGDLLTGSSGPCETFGNSCLAHDSDFELKNVELWGFAHLSRYIT